MLFYAATYGRGHWLSQWFSPPPPRRYLGSCSRRRVTANIDPVAVTTLLDSDSIYEWNGTYYAQISQFY